MGSSVNLEKSVFTTFEVAKICNANITSIKNWIEDGQIRAFRTPGGHYRIEKSVLNDFLGRYGMPNPFVQREQKRVLMVCRDSDTVAKVRSSLGEGADVSTTDNAVEAALLIGVNKPDCLIVDYKTPGVDGNQFVSTIRANQSFNSVRVVAYTDNGAATVENGRVEYTVKRSEGVDALNDRVRQALI